MERRDFLKFALGAVAGAAAFAASATAAPLMPQPLNEDAKLPHPDAEPAITSGDEVDRITPEEVRRGGRGWGRRRGLGRRGWGWRRRRRWGWRRRRYWGYRRRYRRRWRRRYYRRRYW